MAQQTGPHLELRTAAWQTTFHIGERIPLELGFTGPDTKEFQITTAAYDHSRRLSIEKYGITPTTGWSDPLGVI